MKECIEDAGTKVFVSGYRQKEIKTINNEYVRNLRLYSQTGD